MSSPRSPESTIASLAKDAIVQAYRLCIMLLIAVIICGKFVFDALYKLIPNNDPYPVNYKFHYKERQRERR